MNRTMKNALSFLIIAVGIAVIWLAAWGGLAILTANGQSQTCSRSGGQWFATDKVSSTVGNAGVDRVRECTR